MPKPNTYVQLLQAQKAIKQLQYDNHVIKGFTVQQCLDVALIALHNEFHFGPKMTARFESAFLDTFMAYAQIDRKSTRLNSSHIEESRMPSSA